MGLGLSQQQTGGRIPPQQREANFLEEVSQLPDDQQTFANWLAIARKHGATDPVKAAVFWSKEYKNQLTRQKQLQQLTVPENLPPGQTPVTALVVDTLAKAGLPTTGLPTPLQPFGKMLGRPAQLQDIQAIIGQPLPLRQKTPFQPELGVFGPEALRPLPQAADITQTIPTTLLTQAAESLTRALPVPSEERFGFEREALARELVGSSFIKAPKKIQSQINKMVRNKGFKLEVDKDGNVVVTQGDLTQPTMPIKTKAQQTIIQGMQTKRLLVQLRTLVRSDNVGLVAKLRKTFFGLLAQKDAVAQWIEGQRREVVVDAMRPGVLDEKDPVNIQKRFLDPTIPTIEMLSNILSYKLGKMLDLGSKLSDFDVEQQVKSLEIATWLTSPENILPRLDVYEQVIDSSMDIARMVLRGDFTGEKVINWEDVK